MLYLDLLKSWKNSEDVIKYLSEFEFDFDSARLIKNNFEKYNMYFPYLPDLETICSKKKGTCTHVVFFAVKTLNYINRDYAAYGIRMRWECNYSMTNNICIWHEEDKLKAFRFSTDNGGTLYLYKSDNIIDLHNRLVDEAYKSLQEKEMIKYGISVLDLRVFYDKRMQKAINFWGVDYGALARRKEDVNY